MEGKISRLSTLPIPDNKIDNLHRNDYFLSIDVDGVMGVTLFPLPGLFDLEAERGEYKSKYDEGPGPDELLLRLFNFLILHPTGNIINDRLCLMGIDAWILGQVGWVGAGKYRLLEHQKKTFKSATPSNYLPNQNGAPRRW